MDLERQQILDAVLLRYAQLHSSQAKTWAFRYMELRETLKGAIAALGVDNLGIRLHSFRHGEASHDKATNSRPIREIQVRGFWKQRSIAQRYEKHARRDLHLSAIRSASRPQMYQLPVLYAGGLERRFAPRFAMRTVGESSSKCSRALAASPTPSV